MRLWLRLLLLLVLKEKVAMLIQLNSECVARSLEDTLLDAGTEIARVVTQIGAAVKLQKASLTIKNVGLSRRCGCHATR